MTDLKVIKWGILGSGKIAAQFTEQLLQLPDIELVGVASRTVENAQKAQSHSTTSTSPATPTPASTGSAVVATKETEDILGLLKDVQRRLIVIENKL